MLNQFWEKKVASDLWIENCVIQCTDYYEVSETVSSTVFQSLFCGSQIVVTRSHIMENLYCDKSPNLLYSYFLYNVYLLCKTASRLTKPSFRKVLLNSFDFTFIQSQDFPTKYDFFFQKRIYHLSSSFYFFSVTNALIFL